MTATTTLCTPRTIVFAGSTRAPALPLFAPSVLEGLS